MEIDRGEIVSVHAHRGGGRQLYIYKRARTDMPTVVRMYAHNFPLSFLNECDMRAYIILTALPRAICYNGF